MNFLFCQFLIQFLNDCIPVHPGRCCSVQIRCQTCALLQHCVDCLTDLCRALTLPQILQHHAGRPQKRSRDSRYAVRQYPARCREPPQTSRNLLPGCWTAEGQVRQSDHSPDLTADHHTNSCHDDVKLIRIHNHLHTGIINNLIVMLNLRILFRDFIKNA